MNSVLRIAFRNILRNGRRSIITFSAVFLALSIMISIQGFLTGLQETIRESVIFGQTGALQIHRKGFLKSVSTSWIERDLPSDDAFLAPIRAVPGIKAVTPRIAFSGIINANDKNVVGLFWAIDAEHELAVCPQRLEMISSGKTLAQAGPASGIFTPELAASVGLKLGQRGTILVNDKEGVLNALDLDYVGAYGQPGLPLLEKKIGFVPLSFAQELLRMRGRATEIAVAVHRLDEASALKAKLQAVVGPTYEVVTWLDVAAFVEDLITVQNTVLRVVAGIFLFIAMLGIANTMLMSVLERTREIGTMMSIGVRRHQILSIFLLEAALLGLAGGLLGAVVGNGAVAYYRHKGITLQVSGMVAPLHIYPTITAGYTLVVLILAAGGAALAALWPSIRASRMRPIEALASV